MQDAFPRKKMRILVICQYYYPEPFRITDICEGLAARGHEVMVVTGRPNYPEGILYEGYSHGRKKDEVIRGVRVHRCAILPRGRGSVGRLLNYVSYAVLSKSYALSKKCVTSDGKAFDVVFCNQLSPIMMAEAAAAYKRRYRVPLVLYCLDLWPDSLTLGGISASSALFRVFEHMSRRLYGAADWLPVTSRSFRNRLQQLGVAGQRIQYLPQYAEDVFGELEAGRAEGPYRLVFAGNVGRAQNLEVLIRAASLLRDVSVEFHIIGDGTDLEAVQKLAVKEGLENVVFHGRRPLEEMPQFYSMADAMVVTLASDPVLTLTLPGKVQAYMACGKPIIAAANGETAEVIAEAQCGYCGPAEDSDALARNIRLFLDDKDKHALGRNARIFYERHFERQRFLDSLEELLWHGELEPEAPQP